jgi:hypothetical protein
MEDKTQILCFKAIHTFVTELNKDFGSQFHGLELYARLIEKTTFAHEQAIRRHVEAFRKFCVDNREAIQERNSELFKTPKTEFSERISIDFKSIFLKSSLEQRNIIWQHLLTIAAITDPTSTAKQLLREGATTDAGKETEFITNIIDKVESHVQPGANPMEAIGGIMSSGIFSDLLGSMNSGVSSGELDMGKLMGVVQGLMAKLAPEHQDLITGMTNPGKSPAIEEEK